MRLLDASEVDQLASALPYRYGSLATVAAYTGLRWGELAGLQTRSIDRPHKRLNVRTSLIEASGQPPILGSPKTAASERTTGSTGTLTVTTHRLGIGFTCAPAPPTDSRRQLLRY